MKRKLIGSITAVLIATVAFAPAPDAADVLKCSKDTPVMFPDAPEHVYVLNGEAVDEEQIAEIDAQSLELIEVLCAPDLHRMFNVKAKKGGTSIFTKPGPVAVIDERLESIRASQDAYYEKHGTFAADPADLGWTDPSDMVWVKLTVRANGAVWQATGFHRQVLKSSRTVTGRAPARN